MQFNTELYWALIRVFPDLTVRSLSKMMGKSEGYWSSVNTQNLPVSSSALVNLLDALSCQKIQSLSGSERFIKLDLVSSLIEKELLERFQENSGIKSSVADKVILSNENESFSVMPFVVYSYR